MTLLRVPGRDRHRLALASATGRRRPAALQLRRSRVPRPARATRLDAGDDARPAPDGLLHRRLRDRRAASMPSSCAGSRCDRCSASPAPAPTAPRARERSASRFATTSEPRSFPTSDLNWVFRGRLRGRPRGGATTASSPHARRSGATARRRRPSRSSSPAASLRRATARRADDHGRAAGRSRGAARGGDRADPGADQGRQLESAWQRDRGRAGPRRLPARGRPRAAADRPRPRSGSMSSPGSPATAVPRCC